jgi:hypothetical protein
MPGRTISCLSAVALTLVPYASCGGAHEATTTAGPFAGHWWGHTRGLDITRAGTGREFVDGGGYRLITVRFRVLETKGSPRRAVARVKVTFARADKEIMAELHRRPPRVGQLGTLRLRNGVIRDELTNVTFCAPTVDKCGL